MTKYINIVEWVLEVSFSTRLKRVFKSCDFRIGWQEIKPVVKHEDNPDQTGLLMYYERLKSKYISAYKP